MDLPQQQPPPAAPHRENATSSEAQEREPATKVEDLHCKLSKAQGELDKLRDHLASAEVAKVDAEEALAGAKKQVFTATRVPEADRETSEAKPEPAPRSEGKSKSLKEQNEKSNEDTNTMVNEACGDHNEVLKVKLKEESMSMEIIDSSEIVELKATITEKENRVEILLEENIVFKRSSEEEAMERSAAAQAAEEELKAKVASMEEVLKESRAREAQLAEQLAVAEGAKSTLEAEMKKLQVQTEQWRKAAEQAAALLAAADGDATAVRGRRVSERCQSMDAHLAGYDRGWRSPLMDGELEEEAGGGRWRMARIRVFADLWKRKMPHG